MRSRSDGFSLWTRSLVGLGVLSIVCGCQIAHLDPDLNEDAWVDQADVAIVLGCLGEDPAASTHCKPADVDLDSDVDGWDLGIVFASHGAMVCNGSMALCDRRYHEVAYPTTHNAFATLADGFLFLNQLNAMSTQLADGVRGLMLDTWYAEVGGEQDAFLCHADCGAGKRPLVDGLAEIRRFLDEHRGEVVTLIFEANISAADTAAAFAKSGLPPYVHAHETGAPWPTLRELISRNERVFVLTDDPNDGGFVWYHYLWSSLAWETPFGVPPDADGGGGNFVCSDLRGEPENDLFILNHFLTVNLGNPAFAEKVNPYAFFLDRAIQCWMESGKFPNFLTVDFYEIGDVFSVTRTLNILWDWTGGASPG